MVVSLFSIAPLVAATVADERRTAVFAGAAVALAIGAGWWDGATGGVTYWIRVAVVCAICVMAVVVAGMRRRREERLARMTAIAEAAQLALLPPLPPEMTGITIAARYRSATREASVGGDLYEIIPTGHGIRAGNVELVAQDQDLSSRRASRSHAASRVVRRNMNRRHMTGDHHGQTAGRATLLARAVDEILGTHSSWPLAAQPITAQLRYPSRPSDGSFPDCLPFTCGRRAGRCAVPCAGLLCVLRTSQASRSSFGHVIMACFLRPTPFPARAAPAPPRPRPGRVLPGRAG